MLCNIQTNIFWKYFFKNRLWIKRWNVVDVLSSNVTYVLTLKNFLWTKWFISLGDLYR